MNWNDYGNCPDRLGRTGEFSFESLNRSLDRYAAGGGNVVTIGFARSFRWTSFDGSVSEFQSPTYRTHAECEAQAYACARRVGWTPPRWWQWWRWKDNPRRAPAPLAALPPEDVQ